MFSFAIVSVKGNCLSPISYILICFVEENFLIEDQIGVQSNFALEDLKQQFSMSLAAQNLKWRFCHLHG